jgi:hypothetical protein
VDDIKFTGSVTFRNLELVGNYWGKLYSDDAGRIPKKVYNRNWEFFKTN